MSDNQIEAGNDKSGEAALRVLIVDDEELARDGLALRLRGMDDIELLGSCANGAEAMEAILAEAPDVVFLDIQMPGMTGFELIEQLQADVMPLIVFVTAYDAYAIDAFRVHAVDYLLKPVEEERLQESLDAVRAQLAQRRAENQKQRLMEIVISATGKSEQAIGELLDGDDPLSEPLDRLAIKDGSSISFVPIKDIDWIDAAGDYMCVHASGETHIMRTTMKQLESRLDPRIFQRVHRSTIVNLERVEKVSSHINGEFHLTLSCGASLKMSRSYKDKVKHFL